MNWDAFGDTDQHSFVAALKGSPLDSEAVAIYQALRPYTRLGYAQARVESDLGRSALASSAFNFLGQRPRPGDNGPTVPGPFRKFVNFAQCAIYYAAKLSDSNYAYRDVESLEEFIHIYAPASDNNDEAGYVADIQRYVALLPKAGGTPVPTPTKGHVPRPPMIELYEAGNDHNVNQGRSPDAQRWGLIVGTADHTSQGSFRGNKTVYLDPTWGGLTDYQVGGPWDDVYDGVIMVFIDPKSQVVPWANGVVGEATAPYGDAPRFLSKYGVAGVNTRLRSIETTDNGLPDRAKGGRQIESLCFLHAYLHAEEAGQTSETFDFNMHHREFGGSHQQCPGDWIIENVDYIQFRTKEIMDYFQFGKKLSSPLLVTYPPGWDGPDVPLPDVTPAPPKPTTKPYPRPILPAELVADMKAGTPKDHIVNGITYRATKNAYRATRRTRRMQQPIEVTKKVVAIGPSIEPNTALTAWWETGKTLITAHGTSLYKPAFRLIKTGIKGPIPSAEKPVADRK
jgi:hypothetical protein